MRFRQPELPRQTRMLDACLRRRTGPAVVAADQHDVRMAFGHTGGDRANADFRYQLDADTRVVVGVFKIVNQLAKSSIE